MASVFRGVIEFLAEIGIYDVILPFLLVFTIVFAVLEKTRIFGMMKAEDGIEYTKKNLNSMVAFVVSFLVVASGELVRTINEAAANAVVLLLLSILFMILVGSFHKDEEFFLDGWTKHFFTGLMLVGIIFIFLHAIKTEDGTPWLIYGWEWLVARWDTNWVGAIILIAVIVGFMWYVTGNPNKPKDKKSDS